MRSVLFRIFSMIQIPALNNAVLFSGDYLLALSSNDATNPTVCYIVEAVNAEELIITQLLTREQILARNLEAPPTVPIDTYNNTVQCHLTEVFEVRSSPITINRACVRDIAFVFHINSLERAFPNCSGMTRVFFIRFFFTMTTIGCLRYIRVSSLGVKITPPPRRLPWTYRRRTWDLVSSQSTPFRRNFRAVRSRVVFWRAYWPCWSFVSSQI